ncbi:hypothetical protein RN001_016061 [Aquatica leii]|uniref:Tf2-1-like SH3-like domain-containing protein n=1 Tax=Aquatica leii TaxID=1421715 RepID=A0AAN7SB32_9COLE|nr:hypothetical protein RN001_016061 [Aquatica leii]
MIGFQKMYDSIKTKLQQAYVHNKAAYDLRRRSVHFDVGEFVWKRNKVISDASKHFSAKLAPMFIGPYRVKKKIGFWTYELEDDNGHSAGVWHVQDLKPVLNDVSLIRNDLHPLDY